MAESRLFRKAENITAAGIGRSVQNFLKTTKNLVVQGGPAGEGYVVQAKQESGWKKIAGMDTAIEVQISETSDSFMVNIGNAKWADQVGAAAIGWFVFAPLAVTAVVGSVQQQKLPGEIFSHIEKYIANGGKDLYYGADLTNPANGNMVCPYCKSEVPVGTAFCTSCGKSLSKDCPSCGNSVPIGVKYCPKCGADMDAAKAEICSSCGKPNVSGSAFCNNCGASLLQPQLPEPEASELVCPDCGKKLKKDDVFCSGCGKKLAQEEPATEIVCPDCGAVLEPDSKFCSKCGHKF